MADFARIILDNDYFYPSKPTPDACIVKNDAGSIELRGNTKEVVDFIYEVLSGSVAKSTYADTKYGVEYVLSKLIGPSIEYSSDFNFIEEDYEEVKDDFPIKKSFRVIVTKQVNDDEQ